jgi:type II secretory ATPase GspE/PulE/Tfp pilus assembly ATPase PilB-like protein
MTYSNKQPPPPFALRVASSLVKSNQLELSGNQHRAALSLSHCSQALARALLPFEIAQKIGALPLGFVTAGTSKLLTIAVAKERTFDTQQQLRFCLACEFKVLPMDRSTIDAAIFLAYKGDSGQLLTHAESLAQYDKGRAMVTPSLLEAKTLGPSAQFLEELLQHALARDASDIHLHPSSDGTHVAIRIAGELHRHDRPLCSLDTHGELVRRIKVIARLDLANRALPQDGVFTITLASGSARVRINTVPTVYGEKVALRILSAHRLIPLDELGLPMMVLSWIEEIATRGEGSVLFAGPTGSGKSTSMYSFVRELGARGSHVVTIEDPIESLLPGASQLAINTEQGLTYPVALRAVLRQDPDVILVGELRDRESTELALQLAMTGHLLTSTVHGGNVLEALYRLRQLGAEPSTIAHSISMIVALRLIPTRCPSCHSQSPDCTICQGSGFSGRVLVAEALRMTPELSTMIFAHGVPDRSALLSLGPSALVRAHGGVSHLLREGKITPSDAASLQSSLL